MNYVDCITFRPNPDIAAIRVSASLEAQLPVDSSIEYLNALAQAILGPTGPLLQRTGRSSPPLTPSSSMTLRLSSISPAKILDHVGVGALEGYHEKLIAPIFENSFIVGCQAHLHFLSFADKNGSSPVDLWPQDCPNTISHIAVLDSCPVKLMAADIDGTLYSVQPEKGFQAIYSLPEETGPITDLCPHTPSTVIVASEKNGMAVIDTRMNTLQALSCKSHTSSIAPLPNSTTITAGGSNGIEIWDIRKSDIPSLSYGTRGRVHALAWKTDCLGKTLFASIAGTNPTLEAYALNGDTGVQRLCSKHTEGLVQSILCPTQKSTLITLRAHQRETVLFWEYSRLSPDRLCIRQMAGENTPRHVPICGAISNNDSTLLASYSDAEHLVQWDLRPEKQPHRQTDEDLMFQHSTIR